jgi:hypothetical protein
MRIKLLIALTAVAAGVGCSGGKSPAGATGANPEPVASAPAPEQPGEPAGKAAQKAEPEREAVVIPKGTTLRVRIDEPLSTRRNRAGDRFRATLSSPVVLEGKTVVPAGAVCTGAVTESEDSGRLKGRAVLSVRLATVAVDGKEFAVSTNEVVRQSESHKKRNIGFIGGGSGLGAAIGAIAGGGKGALIGAAAGAGAGTAGAAATGKLQVSLPVETALSFSLKSPVTLN